MSFSLLGAIARRTLQHQLASINSFNNLSLIWWALEIAPVWFPHILFSARDFKSFPLDVCFPVCNPVFLLASADLFRTRRGPSRVAIQGFFKQPPSATCVHSSRQIRSHNDFNKTLIEILNCIDTPSYCRREFLLKPRKSKFSDVYWHLLWGFLTDAQAIWK